MKVVVNYDRCEGYARCVNAAPEVFELNDDEQARVKVEQPEGELQGKVERAVRICPRQAIAVE